MKELQERIEKGENEAWSSAQQEPDGTWPKRCRFYITQAGERPHSEPYNRVAPEDAEAFVEELARRELQGYIYTDHPAHVSLRWSRAHLERGAWGWVPISVVVVLLASLLLLPGVALAQGWTPVSPSPNSAIAQAAASGLTSSPTSFWVAEQFAYAVDFTPPSHQTCSPGCTYSLLTGYSNVTYTTPPVPPGAFLASTPAPTMQMLQTQGCGQPCSPSVVNCDGQNSAIFESGLPCFHITIEWPAGGSYASVPSYQILRVQTWVFPTGGGFVITPCHSMSATAVIVDFGPGFLNSEYVNHIVSWTVESVAWVQPLPSGIAYVSGTYMVLDASTNTYLPTSEYYVGTDYSLVQWTQLPTPPFQGSGETGEFADNLTQTFVFSASLSCGGPGSIGGTHTGNSTTRSNYPGTVPGPELPPQTVVLLLGNITTIDAGNLSASATWTNPNAFTFSGSFLLEAPFLPGASYIRLLVNGAPASPGTFAISNDSISIVQGTVPVQNGSTVSFIVDFEKGSTYVTGQVVLVVNGAGFTLADLFLLGALVLALIIGLVMWSRHGHNDEMWGIVAGFAGVGLLGWSWLG